jgi:hypothetical protein
MVVDHTCWWEEENIILTCSVSSREMIIITIIFPPTIHPSMYCWKPGKRKNQFDFCNRHASVRNPVDNSSNGELYELLSNDPRCIYVGGSGMTRTSKERWRKRV